MNLCYSIIICSFLCTLLYKKGSAKSLLCPVTKVPQKFKIGFYLSTRRELNQYYTSNSNTDLTYFNFSPKRQTAIIIHGFISSHQEKHFSEMRHAFLQWKDMNVIKVNWNEGCKKLLAYDQAVANTQSAASAIKNFILRLISSYQHITPIDEWGHFHFVGHSLGAHVAGQTAAALQEEKVTIHRITGLDPALPCFKSNRYAPRLNKSNARFVDVIHTNGERYGIMEPMGHVDFYVNGGKKQPGCSRWDSQRILPCHHNRAIKYFTQSIIQEITHQCQFLGEPWNMKKGRQCNNICPNKACKNKDCLTMGISAKTVQSGLKNFFVCTTGKAPYCNKC